MTWSELFLFFLLVALLIFFIATFVYFFLKVTGVFSGSLPRDLPVESFDRVSEDSVMEDSLVQDNTVEGEGRKVEEIKGQSRTSLILVSIGLVVVGLISLDLLLYGIDSYSVHLLIGVKDVVIGRGYVGQVPEYIILDPKLYQIYNQYGGFSGIFEGNITAETLKTVVVHCNGTRDSVIDSSIWDCFASGLRWYSSNGQLTTWLSESAVAALRADEQEVLVFMCRGMTEGLDLPTYLL